MALLREGEVDFAVGPMLETPPDIKFHPLVTYEPMLITRHDHPLASQPRVTLKDIAKYPLILPPKNQSTYRVVEMVFAEHSLEYDVKLEVGGYDVIKKYVELGLGISIVMSHCLTGADHLHSVPLGRWFPKRTYGAGAAERRGALACGGAICGNDPGRCEEAAKWPRPTDQCTRKLTTEAQRTRRRR